MKDYSKATSMYSDAVRVQCDKMGMVSRTEYQALQLITENAREVSIDFRERLERHIAQHGC